MDINQIIAYGVTALAGFLGGVVVVKAYAKKAFTIATNIATLISEILAAVKPEEDGSVKLTSEEIKRVRAAIKYLMESLK